MLIKAFSTASTQRIKQTDLSIRYASGRKMTFSKCSKMQMFLQFFFKENVRYPIWTCTDPISLILGTRFSLILETRWWFSLILGTRIA